MSLDPLLDLVLGSHCVGCDRPGRLLCQGCARDLPEEPFPSWPTPTPVGLAPPWAVADYDGLARTMVLGLKERRLLALARPLGLLLAGAAAAAAPARGPVVLVPVPSRPASVRARGHDSTYSLTAAAATVLRRHGVDAVAVRLLRTRPGVVDQAGLDSRARAANLAGSMCCPTAALRRLGRIRPHAQLVVCDDVMTTGSTAREAQRALEAVGLSVVGIGTVAATRRHGTRAGCARSPFLDPLAALRSQGSVISAGEHAS